MKQHGGNNSVRDFDTVEEMNDRIVNDINSVVGENDWLVCLGDWAFGGIKNTWIFRNRIACKNVVLVLGNHDEQIDANKVLPNCYWMVAANDLEEHQIVSGQPEEDCQVYTQDIFESVYGRLELRVKRADGSKITYECNHFPWAVWNKAHHGRIQLYGHVHGGYNAGDRSMDVGIDAIWNLRENFVPLSERDVADYVEGKNYIQMSHHNKNTN